MGKADLKSERDLVWVVQSASALSLGTLAALLYSMKQVSPSIQFGVSWATPIAFVLAALGSLAFWQVVFALSKQPEHPGSIAGNAARQRARRFWLITLSGLLAAGLLAAFIYPLKDFSHEKQSEISHGATIAVIFLSVLGLLFWRIVRYLEHVE